MMLNVCVTMRDIVECELRTPPVVLSCFVYVFLSSFFLNFVFF